MARSSITLDLTNMNALFKCNDKFVMALNFNNAVERLCAVASALDSSFDIYLCLKPRAKGEGNFVIEELSLSGVPFEVDREELLQVLSFIRSIQGVGEVYLSNWLSNYIVAARVSTFRSVFYYGDRVGVLSVKDRLVSDFELVKDPAEYEEKYSGKGECYGDVGLMDCEGLAAQYPELCDIKKPQLTALAPLVAAYRNPMKISTDELYDRLMGITVAPEEQEEEPPIVMETPKPPVSVFEPRALMPVVEDPVEEVEWKEYTPAFSAIGKFMGAVACIVALLLGASANIVTGHKVIERSDSYYEGIDTRVENLAAVEKVYAEGTSVMFDVSNILKFAKSYEGDITVIGFEAYPDNYIVRCTCASKNGQSLFVDYIESTFTVLSTNDLGVFSGGEVPQYHFSVTFF